MFLCKFILRLIDFLVVHNTISVIVFYNNSISVIVVYKRASGANSEVHFDEVQTSNRNRCKIIYVKRFCVKIL